MKALLKRLVAWFLTTKLFAFLKGAWTKIVVGWRFLVGIATTEEFKLIFPLVVFAMTALLVHSFVFALCSLLWLIPVADGLTKKDTPAL